MLRRLKRMFEPKPPKVAIEEHGLGDLTVKTGGQGVRGTLPYPDWYKVILLATAAIPFGCSLRLRRRPDRRGRRQDCCGERTRLGRSAWPSGTARRSRPPRTSGTARRSRPPRTSGTARRSRPPRTSGTARRSRPPRTSGTARRSRPPRPSGIAGARRRNGNSRRTWITWTQRRHGRHWPTGPIGTPR